MTNEPTPHAPTPHEGHTATHPGGAQEGHVEPGGQLDEPGHHHEVVDPRWAALADLAKPDRQN